MNTTEICVKRAEMNRIVSMDDFRQFKTESAVHEFFGRRFECTDTFSFVIFDKNGEEIARKKVTAADLKYVVIFVGARKPKGFCICCVDDEVEPFVLSKLEVYLEPDGSHTYFFFNDASGLSGELQIPPSK